MEPDQAVNLLDQVCAQVSLPREGHSQVQNAVSILRDHIKKASKKKDDD